MLKISCVKRTLISRLFMGWIVLGTLACADAGSKLAFEQNSLGQNGDTSTGALPAASDGVPIHDINEGTPQDPELGLATLDNDSYITHSILREYVKATQIQRTRYIRYPFCLYANTPISASTVQMYFGLMNRVVNRWNQALQGVRGWPVDAINLYLVGSIDSCPSTDQGLRVYKLFVDANRDRGFAQFGNFLNVVGLSEFRRADLRRELHEYGHQIGLGDTYSEQGYQLPQGQPPGVMNLYYNVGDITPDDIDGIRHIWARVSGASADRCPAGYVESFVLINRNKHVFCLKPTPVGRFAIKTFANKCLGLQWNAPWQGTPLVQTDCNNSTGQQFSLSSISSGVYRIQSALTGQCLDIQFASLNNGAQLIQWPCHASFNQQFVATKLPNGKFRLNNIGSFRCLDVQGASGWSGAPIVQWDCHGGVNQAFSIPGL